MLNSRGVLLVSVGSNLLHTAVTIHTGTLLQESFSSVDKTVIQIALVGSNNVGKTAFAKRYVYDDYDFDTITTIGINLFQKQVITEKNNIAVVIWDTAGSKRFINITESFLQQVNGIELPEAFL